MNGSNLRSKLYNTRLTEVFLIGLLSLGGTFTGGFLEYKGSQESFKEQTILVQELEKEEVQLVTENEELRASSRTFYSLPANVPFTNSFVQTNVYFGVHSN
jgi:hypothetical protein